MKFLYDFFPVVLFFIAYKTYDIFVATAVIIAASIVQVGYSWLKNRKVEKMHVITLLLVLVLGGATILLHDENFIKWKPTIVNWLFAAVFLGSHFVGKRTIIQRMLDSNISLPSPIWPRLNMLWTGFFVVMGIANLYVAFYFAPELTTQERTDIWVDFKLFGMMGLTILFVILQAIYLARYIQESESETSQQEKNS
ncbi:MAG: septation protein A [Gammaproteobacteria bacterium]|jgi:intracellular septation protein